jgi:hypothetical protein
VAGGFRLAGQGAALNLSALAKPCRPDGFSNTALALLPHTGKSVIHGIDRVLGAQAAAAARPAATATAAPVTGRRLAQYNRGSDTASGLASLNAQSAIIASVG